MIKLTTILAASLLAACGTDTTTATHDDAVNYDTPVVLSSNTCDTAVTVDATTQQSIALNSTGEVWINYTGATDDVQFDTCDSGKGATFEVYHTCEWFENERLDTINGRGDEKVKDCYPGYYGSVFGIREYSVKIRFVGAGDYSVNINEVGY